MTVLDRHNYHVFQPLLYQVATAGLSPGNIASPIRWMLRKQPNARVLMAEVLSIDTARRKVETDTGEIEYDYLVLAAGATHAYFGHDEWARTAPGLKTLDDALHIRGRMLLAFERAERDCDAAERQRLLTFVIVGAGPTGVEMAGAVAEIARHTLASEFRSIETARARIVLVEAGPSVLPAFPPKLRAAAERSLERLGVEVLVNSPVTDIRENYIEVAGRRLEAATVIWAAGVRASPLGRSLGVRVDRAGRVLVEPDLSVPGHPEIFVIGDLAAYLHQDGKPLPGVAPVAISQAKHAARMIVARIKGKPSEPFVYRSPGNLATIGRAAAVADFGWIKLSGYVAWLAWLFVHIMKLVGFRNRVLVFIQWAAAYFTYQRSVRLITRQADDWRTREASD